nr:MAG TPA: hypothetical protein [Caudoviricetes sp.]
MLLEYRVMMLKYPLTLVLEFLIGYQVPVMGIDLL